MRFNDLRCDGYVLHSRYLSDDDLRELAKLPTPFVLLDRQIDGLKDRCVTYDHANASQVATEHLLRLGHRKIGCISGPSNRHNNLLRRFGYINAMKNAGISVDESWYAEGSYGRQSGFDAMEQLLHRYPDMTAVFSCSEEMTFGAMQYLNKEGIKVPDQISLVSFDSVDLCAGLYPPVSAVHFPISEMARSAVQTLMTQITQQTKTRCYHFSGELK